MKGVYSMFSRECAVLVLALCFVPPAVSVEAEPETSIEAIVVGYEEVESRALELACSAQGSP